MVRFSHPSMRPNCIFPFTFLLFLYLCHPIDMDGGGGGGWGVWMYIYFGSWSGAWHIAKPIFYAVKLGPNVRKRTFRHVRPAMIQISLRIRADWSKSSLGLFWIAKDAQFIRTTKTLIRLRGCAGWSESSFVSQSEGMFSHTVVILIIFIIPGYSRCTLRF